MISNIRRARKSGYHAGLPAVADLCEQVDDKLFRALRYNPIHPSIGYYHLSAVNHTSPVAVYIITLSPPRLLLSMKVILCVAKLYKDCF